MNNKVRLLLIDDSEDIHLLVKRSLSDICEVFSAYTADQGRQEFEERYYEVVIIDLMLGAENGMNLLKEFKEVRTSAPTRFLIMTGKDSSSDEIQSHTYGVDEYLKKPVDRELLKAIVRKNLKIIRDDQQEVLEEPPFTLISDNLQAFLEEDGKKVELHLTVKEFKLLQKFVSHPEKIFSREELFAQVWNNDSDSTFRTIDMHVSSLRKKLRNHASLIKTVHQVGYKFSRS